MSNKITNCLSAKNVTYTAGEVPFRCTRGNSMPPLLFKDGIQNLLSSVEKTINQNLEVFESKSIVFKYFSLNTVFSWRGNWVYILI